MWRSFFNYLVLALVALYLVRALAPGFLNFQQYWMENYESTKQTVEFLSWIAAFFGVAIAFQIAQVEIPQLAYEQRRLREEISNKTRVLVGFPRDSAVRPLAETTISPTWAEGDLSNNLDLEFVTQNTGTASVYDPLWNLEFYDGVSVIPMQGSYSVLSSTLRPTVALINTSFPCIHPEDNHYFLIRIRVPRSARSFTIHSQVSARDMKSIHRDLTVNISAPPIPQV